MSRSHQTPEWLIFFLIYLAFLATPAVPVLINQSVPAAVKGSEKHTFSRTNTGIPGKSPRVVLSSSKTKVLLKKITLKSKVSITSRNQIKLLIKLTSTVRPQKNVTVSARGVVPSEKRARPESIRVLKTKATSVRNADVLPVSKKSSAIKASRSNRTQSQSTHSKSITTSSVTPLKQLDGTSNASHNSPKKELKQQKAPLASNIIETNVTALNSSISVVEHKAFRNGELFCYIRGVCRLGDGKYMLPAWMKQHNDTLARCGLNNIMYVLHSRNDGRGGRPKLVLKGFPRPKLNVSDEFRDIDVIGATAPRPEQPNLVADLTPSIQLADIFMRPHVYGRTISARCLEEHKNSGCANANSLFPGTFNASMLVDVGLSAVKDHLWPKGVIRLLRNGFDGSLQVIDLQDVYGWRFRNHASCFRSLLVTNATVPAFAAAAKPRTIRNASVHHTSVIRADNFMYRANGLSRVPVLELSRMGRARCDLKVLLMDRVGQGRILDINVLTKALAILNVRLAQSFPSASILAEAVYFQNISFHEQVRVMQESDIVVASHSDLNANLPFLRPRAHFFEILPFGIRPDLYRSLAQAYNVRYRYLHATPDSEMFKLCVNHYNNDITDEVDFLLARWNTAANKFIKATNLNASAPTYFYLSEDQEDESYGELRNVKGCAMMQRVTANVKHLAESVFRAAMTKCGIRSAYAQKAVFFGR